MGQKLFLHVGAPKTGTTYLQDRLVRNRASLAKHGIKYPVGLRDSMFLAAVDLTGIKWPGFQELAAGEWQALVRRIKAARGTIVVSHEVFAVAEPDRIAAVMKDLAGYEVHVVFTSRDPGRQVAADWQESLKTYRSRTFRRYLDRTVKEDPMTSRQWFWRAQHLPRSLANWSAVVPPDRVHLITLPPGRSDALWLSFCQIAGIDPAWAPEEAVRHNQSLGLVGAQALRQINLSLQKAGVSKTAHRDIVFNTVVPHLLEVIEKPQPVRTPPDLDPWVAELSEEWIAWVEESGIEVIGGLEALRPRPLAGPWRDPDLPRPRRVQRLLLAALVASVEEASSRPAPEAQLPARIKRACRRAKNRFVTPA